MAMTVQIKKNKLEERRCTCHSTDKIRENSDLHVVQFCGVVYLHRLV